MRRIQCGSARGFAWGAASKREPGHPVVTALVVDKGVGVRMVQTRRPWAELPRQDPLAAVSVHVQWSSLNYKGENTASAGTEVEVVDDHGHRLNACYACTLAWARRRHDPQGNARRCPVPRRARH